MSDTVPLATRYQLAVEHWNGTAWIAYYTWTNPNAFVKFVPAFSNALYHFRVRAQNTHGWGAWSGWSSFEYGKYTGPRPGNGGSIDGGAEGGAVADSGAGVDSGTVADSGAGTDGGCLRDGTHGVHRC